jgi:hypothetical protein
MRAGHLAYLLQDFLLAIQNGPTALLPLRQYPPWWFRHSEALVMKSTLLSASNHGMLSLNVAETILSEIIDPKKNQKTGRKYQKRG